MKTEITYHDSYQVVLPIEVVDMQINTNKVKEIELLLPKFLAMLENGTENGRFSTRVRQMVLNMCSPEIPTLEQVRQQFPLSKRTMQRRLMEEGRSFRAIVNTIKKELSEYLIHEKHLKVMDVAHILGYSESSAYLHAVRSWKN